MIRIAYLLCLSIGISFQGYAQPEAIPKDVSRIVFLGNSITYGGRYIEFVDVYFSLNYPDWEFEIINVGLPSETVSGLSEEGHAGGDFPRPDLHDRLDRALEQTKPDFVFTCYGMNDGIYLPFSEKRFKKYKKGMERLHRKIEQSGAQVIHITPPIYDERKGAAYANVLDIYSDWLLSKQYTEGWRVIDIHWPMQKKLEQRRSRDPDFVFAKDGVHPNESGHFEIARQLLLSLGEDALLEMEDSHALLLANDNGKKILELVERRQRLTKDAWLTSIGHQRPRMKEGLPLEEALQKAKEIGLEITQLTRP